MDKDGEEEAKPAPETDVLWYMARSTDHRHLLKHPVITSFLALKWSRISLHYNANIACFALFVAILTAYIFTNYAGFSLNVSAPICSSDTNSTTTLLSPLSGRGELEGIGSYFKWYLLTPVSYNDIPN